MRSGRAVEIAAREGEGGHVELRVYDTGPGLAPEVVESLFDPFVTTKAEGVGLGLAPSAEGGGGPPWTPLGHPARRPDRLHGFIFRGETGSRQEDDGGGAFAGWGMAGSNHVPAGTAFFAQPMFHGHWGQGVPCPPEALP